MSLMVQEILKKDITRAIDGVIKANDESHLLQEVEEFVITRDIERDLKKLTESYGESIAKGRSFPFNGVWISGYFGSGKSHLLKMLSLILSDRRIDGIRLRDIFLDKLDDAMFRADLEKILDVPATSILFNIEQMASAQAADPILFAFNRMFNRMRGYYDESGPVSKFERDLDDEGSLEKFKTFFLQRNEASWEQTRSKVLLLKRAMFVETLAAFKRITNEQAEQIIRNYENQDVLTVDDFCKEVASWLDRQPDPRHRINFFIDEIGQFIEDKPQLTLSLQTIVESLGVATNERAWVFVTSQEALDRLIGDRSQKRENNFSKIIARFKFRIALSSADVKEVIQKRLLEKNEKGTEALRDFYHEHRDSLRTVFNFQEGARTVTFANEESFIYSYLFPAYQFDLLQNALHGLGEHNAFIGQHVSRGERSMLEIFQDVAKAYRDRQLFFFAPFDAMYNGISATLQTGLIMAINQAERNLGDEYALRILKALLLVKYVGENFKATIENLTVLLTESIDQNTSALKERLQHSLALLEREMYIRRNGSVYEYLTNEEKDAEAEIRAIAVETSQFRKFVGDYVFGEIIKSSKLTYAENGQDYAFQKAIDDESPKGQGDLVLRVITPWHPDAGDRTALLARAMGKKELAILLPSDTSFMQELELYYKTYSWLNRINPSEPKYARIVADKRAYNEQRKKSLNEACKKLVSEAGFAIGDQEIEVTGTVPLDRIERAFQNLVSTFYPNLRMIKERYTQESLRKILYEDHGLYDAGEYHLSEAEQEMRNWLLHRFQTSQMVTLKMIKDAFSSGSYGWYEWAILSIVAKLFVAQQIELQRASEGLSRDEVFTVLNQNRGHDAIRIVLMPEISAQDIQRLKSLHFQIFHTDNNGMTPKDCGMQFIQKLKEKSDNFAQVLRYAPSLPFVSSLKAEQQKLVLLLNKEWQYFLEKIDDYAPELSRLFEEVIDPATKFLTGPNVATWRAIDEWLSTNHDNLSELEMPDALNAIIAIRESPELYRTSDTKRAKDFLAMLTRKLETLLSAAREETKAVIKNNLHKLEQLPEWKHASDDFKNRACKKFQELEEKCQNIRSLGAIRDCGATQTAAIYEQLRNDLLGLISDHKDTQENIPKFKYATVSEKRVPYAKQILATEQDVDEYVQKLAAHWKTLIAQGKRIEL